MDNDITVVFRFKDDFTLPKMKECLIPTQDAKPSFGQWPKDGFVSKWVYNFWPAKNLHTYQDILHSFIQTSHRGWSTAKKSHEIL